MSSLAERIAARKAELASGGNVSERIALRRQAIEAERNADGTYGQPPEGFALDPNTGQMVDVAARDRADKTRIAGHPVAARVQEAVQGLPLIGEWADEAVGLVNPAAAQDMRAMSDAMERQHPVQSAALNIGGGIAGSLPYIGAVAGTKAADWVGRGTGMVSKSLRAGAVAAPAAALEGASSFAGRGETAKERAEGAGIGALVGGTLGAAIGVAAPLIGRGVTSIAKRIKGLDVTTIADQFGVSPDAARMVKKALENDNLAEASRRLKVLGDDAMLADAGDATGALLDAGTATGGRALKVARGAVDGRASKIGGELPARLDNILGRPVGVRTAAREISEKTAPVRAAAYNRAYSKPIDYASDAGRKIEGVLGRIPSKTVRAAIEEANDAMRAKGVQNLQILADIADDGAVTFREMPNVQQLDELKKALDNVGRMDVDKFNRPTAAGSRAKALARDLKNALADAVPEYRVAVKIGGDKIQMDQALDIGRRILSKGTTWEDVADVIGDGLSREAKDAARQGLREAIEETLSNVKRTITDPKVDAREAMALVKEMSSRANFKKVSMILGEPRAKSLLKELDRQAAALELRATIAANSKTAIRTAIREEGQAEVAPGLVRRTAGNMGNPLDAAKEITQTIAGIDVRSMTDAERKMFGEVAESLVKIKGDDARRALVAVRRAMAGQPMKDEAAELIGRVLTGASGVGFYQTGKQPLRPQ